MKNSDFMVDTGAQTIMQHSIRLSMKIEEDKRREDGECDCRVYSEAECSIPLTRQ